MMWVVGEVDEGEADGQRSEVIWLPCKERVHKKSSGKVTNRRYQQRTQKQDSNDWIPLTVSKSDIVEHPIRPVSDRKK